MYIKRDLERKVLKYLGSREILAIMGPRQCGKTTLMNHVFEGLDGNKKFISFEDRETLEMFVQDIDLFVEQYVKGVEYLFIDEFQYAKEGGKKLKFIYDTHDTKIIISGSSVAELSIQSLKYLVGRVFMFNLYPLSFEEFLRYKNERLFRTFGKNEEFSEPATEMINEYYEEFVIYGGYPRVVTSGDTEEKKEVLRNIYNTYFLREVMEIFQLQEDFKLSKLIRILALQIGGMLNYQDLSSASGFNYKELRSYLNMLNKTFIHVESRPYFTNKKKEIVKAPKSFFVDIGFRNSVINNFQKLEKRPDAGGLNENFVATELIKKDIELRYWRTKAGAEVDFIVEAGGKLTPLEIKSGLKDARFTKSFRSFVEEYEPRKGFVFSYAYSKKKKLGKTDVYFRPLFKAGELGK